MHQPQLPVGSLRYLCYLTVYLFRVELKSGKATEKTSYNSASRPGLNLSSLNKDNMRKYLNVGYHKDSSGVSDVTKASIKISKDFLTFSSCIKHIEATGKKMTSPASKYSKSSSPVPSVPVVCLPPCSRPPLGLGRQPGQTGAQRGRQWGHLEDRVTASQVRRHDSLNTAVYGWLIHTTNSFSLFASYYYSFFNA